MGYISIVIAEQATPESRKTLIAYCVLFSVGIFSTSLPGALIPDSLLSFNQLINAPPAQLFNRQFRKWLLLVFGLMLPPVIVALYDPGHWLENLEEKLAHMVSSLLIIPGMGLYSFMHYYQIGPKSQSWQEGTSGQTWDKVVEFNPTMKPPLPRGLLPALTATSRVFVVGMLALVAALKLDQALGHLFILIPGVALLLWTLRNAYKLRPRFDKYYYHTNAFYDEVFRRGSISISDRVPIPYNAVYWVPAKWRAHTWASLLQFDRVLPVGRFMTIALVIYWIVTLQHPPGTIINAVYMVLVLCAKNLTVLTLTKPKLAPDLIEATFQSKPGWSMTRFFVNLRWTMPLLIALCLVAWLAKDFTYTDAILWTALDVVLSFVFAWVITYATFKFQRPHLTA